MNLLKKISLIDFSMSRAEFYDDLAEMFETGQKIRSFLENQASINRKTKRSSFETAYREMLRRFDSGDDGALSDLLSDIVPESDMVTLTAIDEGSALTKHIGLRELASAVRRQKGIKKLMFVSLATPVVIIPFIAFLAYILANVIVSIGRSAPDFLQPEIFSGFNELVRVLAVGTMDYGVQILVGLIALVTLFVVMLPRLIGPVRLKLDSFIGFSLYRDFQSAAFFGNLALLLDSGKKLIPALEVAGSRGSRWSRWQVRRILGYLEDSPTEYAQAFSLGVCSPFVEGRISTLVQILQERAQRGDNKMEFADVIITLGKVEVDRAMERIRLSALAMNGTLLAVLFAYAGILGIGSMTVPGKFAEMSDPNTMSLAKANYEARKALNTVK